MNTVRRLTTLALLAAAGPCLAFDLQPEIGIGATQFTPHGDGTWYQKEAGPYGLVLRSPAFSVGATGFAASLPYGADLRWRAGAAYLGKYGTSCACMSSDAAYEALLAGEPVEWPLSSFRTKGDAFGVRASLLPGIQVGGVRLFAEVGAGYFGFSNKVTVENWRPALDSAQLVPGPAQPLRVNMGRKWGWTPIVGAGISWGQGTSLALNAQRVNVKDPLTPIPHGWAYTVELRAAF